MNTQQMTPANIKPPPTMTSNGNDSHTIMETVLMRGDLGKLTPAERNTYYMATCHSLGLNPLTRPFDYITLNGKITLYAKRDCADQLRRLRDISVEVVSRTIEDELLTVHVRATDATGRKDEDYGVVALGQLRGEARANAMLKAVTKAKRRVTLSICGLGLLDETEVEDIPAKAKAGVSPDGWPQGSIIEDGDYEGGTRERDTKPKEEAQPSWRKIAGDMVNQLRATTNRRDHNELAMSLSASTEWQDMPTEWSDWVSQESQKQFDILGQRHAHIGLVVHDTDDMEPRPAGADDFPQPEYPSKDEPAPPRPQPEEGAISRRATSARTNPGRRETPEEIADYLKA
jgi:hypothetical protein